MGVLRDPVESEPNRRVEIRRLVFPLDFDARQLLLPDTHSISSAKFG